MLLSACWPTGHGGFAVRIATVTRLGVASLALVWLIALLMSRPLYMVRNHACDEVRGSWNERCRRCDLWHPREGHKAFVSMMSPASPLDLMWWMSLGSAGCADESVHAHAPPSAGWSQPEVLRAGDATDAR